MGIMKGDYFKIIPININGRRYYFICSREYLGYVKVCLTFNDAVEQIKDLDKFMHEIDEQEE